MFGSAPVPPMSVWLNAIHLPSGDQAGSQLESWSGAKTVRLWLPSVRITTTES